MEKLDLSILKHEGFYITPLLKKIITVLSKTTTPLSVADILGHMKNTKLTPNKTTVYRLLTKLAEAGLVQESLFTDEVRRYCLTLDKSHHHHFVCQECGYAEELPHTICNQVAVASRELQKRGHEVATHVLDIEGLCKTCASV